MKGEIGTLKRPKEYEDAEIQAWFNSRPQAVKDAFLKWPPGKYRYKGDNGELHAATYTIIGYEEDDDGGCTTCRLSTEGVFGMFPREIFGMKLDRLVPIQDEEQK